MKNIDQLLNQTQNKTLLVIFPHPDDESVMAAGLIQRAISLGFRVVVICLTRGEGGQIHINGRGKSIVAIRTQEFGRAMKLLGVSEYQIWHEGDGKLKTQRSWKKKVSLVIDNLKPGIVVTYDHSGVSGHPDHIALSIEVLRQANSLPDTKLLWPAFSGRIRDKMVNPKVVHLSNPPTHQLQLGLRENWVKWQVLLCHKSQRLFSHIFGLRLLIMLLMHSKEEYALADKSKRYSYQYIDFDLGWGKV